MASQNTNKYGFEIKGGPSKFDLMVSLFDGGWTGEKRRKVHFSVEGIGTLFFTVITMIRDRDMSGEDWDFEGSVQTEFGWFSVHGYYASSSRNGHLEFYPPADKCIGPETNWKVVWVPNEEAKKKLDAFLSSLTDKK